MDLQRGLAGLPKSIAAFRKSIWFWVLYVLVLSLIVYALVTEFASCLTLILAPVVMFVFPYWLKERRLRWYAVNGLVVLLVAGLLFGYFFAASLHAGPLPQNATFDTAGSNHVYLMNGTVYPLSGVPNTQYNFTVTVKDTGAGVADQYAVWMNSSLIHATDLVAGTTLVQQYEMRGDSAPLTVGREYYVEVTVPDDIFFFSFGAQKIGSNATYRTLGTVGPIVAGFGTFFSFSFVYGMLGLMLPVVAFYYLILMLYWYTRRARQMRGPTGTVTPAETETGFMCTNCGADVPEDAAKCPKCGAVFEGEEDTGPKEEPPKAGEGPDAKP